MSAENAWPRKIIRSSWGLNIFHISSSSSRAHAVGQLFQSFCYNFCKIPQIWDLFNGEERKENRAHCSGSDPTYQNGKTHTGKKKLKINEKMTNRHWKKLKGSLSNTTKNTTIKERKKLWLFLMNIRERKTLLNHLSSLRLILPNSPKNPNSIVDTMSSTFKHPKRTIRLNYG